jgi:hypothetical protein
VSPRSTKLGVPARELSDKDLKRELRYMWHTREATVLHGGQQAIATHTHRMIELELEFIYRFPQETVASPARTRRGSRARSGQPSGKRPD